MSKVKIITLNCWGMLPVMCKDKDKRIRGIAERLLTESPDIVCLQEIWLYRDYLYLKQKLQSVLPYSFYFSGGYVGCGVVILSKWELLSTLLHSYTLNGFPHHIHRGDWFSGAAVCMATVRHEHFSINIYGTHLHANYHDSHDWYHSHRIVQAYELAEFVRLTSNTADVSIVLGDFNLRPKDLGHQIIKENGQLDDVWESHLNPKDATGNTFGLPTNPYTRPHELLIHPDGIRIDHIYFRSNSSTSVTVAKCHVGFKDPKVHLSDHEPLIATLDITKHNPKTHKRVNPDLQPLINEAVEAVSERLVEMDQDRVLFTVYLTVSLLLLGIVSFSEVDCFLCKLLVVLTQIGMSLWCGFCFIYGSLVLRLEKKALMTAKSSMLVSLNNPHRLRKQQSNESDSVSSQ